jgi:predicted amidohydrolase YtcJ
MFPTRRATCARFFLVLALICMVAAAQAGGARAADLILRNGRIYTAAQAGPAWAEAVAITGERIEAVGSDADILRLKTKRSRVVDLGGRMVVPGFVDSHTHLWFGALVHDGFNLTDTERSVTPADGALFVETVRSYARAHPEKTAIFGRGDFSMAHQASSAAPFRALLDQAEAKRPLIIHHPTEHAYMVNSRALALAGITDQPLPNPLEEKYIDRDSAGRPTGLVLEGAMQAIERSIPRPPLAEQERLMGAGLAYLNSFGITSALATTGGPEDLALFSALRRHGRLTARVRQAFASVAVNHQMTPRFLADLEHARRRYNDTWISAGAVKFFMDGIRTDLLYQQDDFQALVGELDRRGFIVLTHAFSPQALGAVLDSYEAVERSNGPRPRLFRIEHAVSVTAPQLEQFSRIRVSVSMQPLFCCGPPIINPWTSLDRSGATVAFSSDWPCTWPPNPLLGIRAAALRYKRRPLTPTGPVGPLVSDDLPDERFTPEQALLAYTRKGAEVSGWNDRGVIQAGKLADLAVLSTNILEVAPETIADAHVLATVVGGKVVYGVLP